MYHPARPVISFVVDALTYKTTEVEDRHPLVLLLKLLRCDTSRYSFSLHAEECAQKGKGGGGVNRNMALPIISYIALERPILSAELIKGSNSCIS